MYLLWVVQIIAQIYFAIHAGRTGRYAWIFIILIFPLVGSIVYFFVEYLPEQQIQARVKKPKVLSPKKEIQLWEQELAVTDCVKNRVNLAKAYCRSGRYQDSIDTLEKGVSAAHSRDPEILEGLVVTHFYGQNYYKSLEYLFKLEKSMETKLSNDLRLLKAKALEAIDDIESALKEYCELETIFTGEEARCRYAMLLKKSGQLEKAQDLFNQIIHNAKLYPKQYKRFQSEWVNIAKLETT